jgi:flagellar biosynthesis/type III secretory pathway protein FliH
VPIEPRSAQGHIHAKHLGTWMAADELEALRASCLAEGRALGASEAEKRALQAAQAQAAAKLQRELDERMAAQASAQAEKWRSLATNLATQAQSLRETLEAEVSEWTFAAVTRLLGKVSAEGVAASVRQVLAEVRLFEALTVLLHPQDFAALQRSRHQDPLAWPATVDFRPDELIQLGGCRIQSPHLNLDARLEVQLALLRESLDRSRRCRHAA